jgi:NADH dehydrogenase FAD-containing subunit
MAAKDAIACGYLERNRHMAAKERLVIVGGDAAGMSAAAQARRMRDDLEIVAFERGQHTSYSA